MRLNILDFYSVDEFIVDDNDDDDLEEEVFMDPGFTPEEYDSDKENDDCIEIATPGTNKNHNYIRNGANLLLTVCSLFTST